MTALVEFMDLVCHKTEDNGDDEIYILFNGSNIYGGEDGESISQGQSRNLRGSTHPFVGLAHVAMFDEDWPDSDDALGDVTIFESQAGQGVQTAVFNWDDAHYTLTYRVERSPFG
jgi:hypothetical protein